MRKLEKLDVRRELAIVRAELSVLKLARKWRRDPILHSSIMGLINAIDRLEKLSGK